MRKRLARAVLGLLALAALAGLWVAPVTLDGGGMWPLAHHTRVLYFIVVLLGYVAVAYLAGLVVVLLWRWAEL